MKDINVQRYRWSTSSFGSAPDTSPMELAMLGEHLHRCEGKRGLASSMGRVGRAVDRFVAYRLFTTVALLAIASTLFTMLM